MDPRALAKKLADEAEARVAEEARAQAVKKKRKTKPKKQPEKAAAAPAPRRKKSRPKAKAPAKPKQSLAQRAKAPTKAVPPPTARKMSAAEALRKAIAEEAKEGKLNRRPKKAASQPAPQAAPQATTAAPAAPAPTTVTAPAPAPARIDPVDPGEVVRGVFANASVGDPIVVKNPEVFRALWQANRVRAIHSGDLALAATASVLLDAAGRVPVGHLIALRVELDGQAYAMWVDQARGALLGLASPPEIYLAGL